MRSVANLVVCATVSPDALHTKEYVSMQTGNYVTLTDIVVLKHFKTPIPLAI
jgi:hypothetical protein